MNHNIIETLGLKLPRVKPQPVPQAGDAPMIVKDEKTVASTIKSNAKRNLFLVIGIVVGAYFIIK